MEKSGFGSQKTWPTAEPTDPLGVSPLPRLTSRRVRASPPREERSTWRRLCPVLGVWLFLGVRKSQRSISDIFEKIRPDISDVDLFEEIHPGVTEVTIVQKNRCHIPNHLGVQPSYLQVADQYLQGQNVLHLKTCEL